MFPTDTNFVILNPVFAPEKAHPFMENYQVD